MLWQEPYVFIQNKSLCYGKSLMSLYKISRYVMAKAV